MAIDLEYLDAFESFIETMERKTGEEQTELRMRLRAGRIRQQHQTARVAAFSELTPRFADAVLMAAQRFYTDEIGMQRMYPGTKRWGDEDLSLLQDALVLLGINPT